MFKKLLFTAAALVSFAATNALAQSTDLQSRVTASFINEHAKDFADNAMTVSQLNQMKFIAEQAATAAVCDGVILDEAKFTAAFASLQHEDDANMSDEEKTYYNQHLHVVYGVMVGGALSAAAIDPAGYCEAASADMNDAELKEQSLFQ